MRISRTVMAVCGVVLAAALIGFTNPKAVHAVTAALVDVTNTASNPVVGQSIAEQAAQLVNVDCGLDYYPRCVPISPSQGSFIPPYFSYIPPANQSFVITAVDITANQSCSTPTAAYLYVNYPPGYNYPPNFVSGLHRWFLQAKSGTVHFSYPSGIVVPAQTYLTTAYDTSACPVAYFNLYGYLTNN
jgi:hypothetical protein